MEKLPERPSKKHFGDQKVHSPASSAVYGDGASLPPGGRRMTGILLAGRGILTPNILERPSAYPPAQGRYAHLPYGLWVCPDGWQLLHDRNYVPRWARAGDGHRAFPVPLLPDGRGRWVEFATRGWFFIGGEKAWLTQTHAVRRKAARLAVAHGERILNDFKRGRPVWRYVARGDGIPVGFDRWSG